MFRQDWEYCRFTAGVCCLLGWSYPDTLWKIQQRLKVHSEPGVMDWNIATKTTILIWNPNCRTSKFTYFATKDYWSDHVETKSLGWMLIKLGHQWHIKKCLYTGVVLTQPMKSRDCKQPFRSSARGTEHIPKAPGMSQRCRTVRQSIAAV